MREKTLSLTLPLNLSALSSALIFTILSVFSFIVPFLFGHPQWLVGTIVNACLFSAVIFLPKKFILPIIIFPGLGVASRGIIFGPFTIFLVYFLPFIWLANLALVMVFKKLFPHFNYLFSVFLSATAKFLSLFIIAIIYFEFSLIPKAFLQLMGINQFLTAIAGGLISWVIFNYYEKYNPRNQRTSSPY